MLYLIGALVTAFAPSFSIMVVGRFVYGIGIGLVIELILFYFMIFLIFAVILTDFLI